VHEQATAVTAGLSTTVEAAAHLQIAVLFMHKCLSIYTVSSAVKAVAADPSLLGKLGRICR
jgi:hypothetical protein